MKRNNKKSRLTEGERIREQRLRIGLTQEELARKVGVTTHTIWRLENTMPFNPRVQTLRSIAKALSIEVNYLLS